MESARSPALLKAHAQPTRSFIISLVVFHTLQSRIKLALYLSPSMFAVGWVGDGCLWGLGAKVEWSFGRVKEISRSSKGSVLACMCTSRPSAALELTPPNASVSSTNAWLLQTTFQTSRHFSANVAAGRHEGAGVEGVDLEVLAKNGRRYWIMQSRVRIKMRRGAG